MKMKKIIIYGLGVLLISSSVSCKKRFDEMNVSPNNPADAPAQMLLSNVIASTAYRLQLSAGLVMTDLWVQHAKATTYMDEDKYNPRNDRMDIVWSSLYATAFEDCIQAQNKAEENSQPNVQAIALVLKGYIGYNLTMLMGDVPYAEAGLGNDGIITPVYDPQLTVLNSIVADLDKAISLMDPATGSSSIDELPKYDLIYGGDMDKWKKFAGSLKLRIYLTMNSGGVNKTAEINTLLSSADIFQSNADEAKLTFVSSGNPVYQWINPSSARRSDFRVSSSLVNYMMGSSVDSTLPADKRLTIFADPIADGKYVGGTNGQTGGIATNSTLGSNYYSYSSPYYFMSYSEVLFIKAEMDTTNQANYEAAVTESFIQNGLTGADATAMLADPKFTFAAAKGGKLIGEQKWVSLFGQGVEAYNSWRRSGYPRLAPAANAATTNGYVPRRVSYNTDEKNLNTANLAVGVQGLTPSSDVITSKVWFDRLHPNNFGNQ